MNPLDVALGVLALSYAATMIRMAKGPSDADRAVAADLAFFILIAGIVLGAVRLQQDSFFDVAIVATIIGFLASITLAALVDRPRRDRARKGGEQP